MCYHTSIPERNVIEKAFDYALLSNELEHYYHHLSGFSFATTPVITSEQPTQIQFYNWGLIPKWVKDEEQAKQSRTYCLNATCENVFDKPSFRGSIGKKRCLVIVDGFYEWQEFNGKKYPYFIYLKNHEPFSLAGIYEQWLNKTTGEILNTYSIITCPANPIMEKIHNKKKRMPVILSKQNEKIWLDTSLDKENIQKLMVPFDENLMGYNTISKLITSRTENSNVEKVKEPFVYAELLKI